MNTAIKLALVGTGSFIAGAVTGYFVTKKAFATAAQEEIDSIHEMYALMRKEESPEDTAKRLLNEEALEKLRRKLAGEWSPDELSPANVTLNGEPVDTSYPQEPLSIFDEAEKAEVDQQTVVLNQLLENRVPTQPYVITMEEFLSSEWDHHDKEVLKYYDGPDGDVTLVDESETIVPEIEDIIGDAYNYFGVGSQDKDIVYVRREMYSVDYEIHRVPVSFVEAIHGISFDADQETARRPKKMPREV